MDINLGQYSRAGFSAWNKPCLPAPVNFLT